MAGYLITLSDENDLKSIIETGTYSTNLSVPKFDVWSQAHEGVFTDYLSMKADDLIFFFVNRKIYGCGKLVNVGKDCKYFNYLSANKPNGNRAGTFKSTCLLKGSTSKNRCFCTFVPNPYFFKKGIDMDAVLQNRDNPFRSIRSLWKLSFIKLDDDESKALFGVILKANEDNITKASEHFVFNRTLQKQLSRLSLYTTYGMNKDFLISGCKTKDNKALKHEMALEAVLCEILSKEDRSPFGKWDYISHQVPASPFKPIDYMDKMDIFGYRYIDDYDVKSKYLIAELKKDVATVEIVEQIMKYVDWVANEYANKDYSMIEAFIVAKDFDAEVKPLVEKHCKRNFTKGFRPTEFCIWDNIKMVKYEITDKDDIVFDLV